MIVWWYPFVFLLGLVVGSFLNCVVCRLEENKSFLKGRSRCPRCARQLAWYDLVPLASFLLLRGKCRYCQKSISWQYPLVEVLTGAVFLSVFYFFSPIQTADNALDFFFLTIISCFLVVIFVYDLKHFLIPDNVLFSAIVITIVYRLSTPFLLNRYESYYLEILGYLLAIFIASGFFLLLFLVSQGKWIGFGDVKLAVLMGLLTGFPGILVALFLSFIFGATIGLGLMAVKRKQLKSEIPFAPFLIAGTLLAIFFGGDIIEWYLQFSHVL